MKCSACANNECGGKYENRDKCLGKKENIECTCLCRITKQEAIVTSAGSIVAGAAAVAAGVGLTVMTGGLFAIVAGASIMGAGSSLILTPIQKQISGECMSANETAKDVALGATIGAITGPIGSFGSGIAAKSTSVLAKFGIRALAGSSAGAVSGAVAEGSRYLNGEDVSLKSVTKSMALGAAVGTVGGASAHLASSASNQVTNEVSKAVTRVGVQGASAAATDAGIQLYTTGSVDMKQLALNTTGQLTVAATAEASSVMSQRTTAYNNKINNELIEKNNLSPEEAKSVKKVIKEMNTLKDIENGKRVGKSNIHVLERDRVGQVAGDIGGSGDNGRRGAGRVITEKINGKYVYVDHTMDHDYKGCKATIANQIQNPLDATLRPDQVNSHLIDLNDDECIDDDKFKME